jgi:uncharacterized protein YbjT (DUF2867 family)
VRGWATSIRADGEVREPYAANRMAVVHEADVGAVAAAALLQDGHAGRAYPITGSEALTVPERVAAIAAAVGRPVRFVELTEVQARERWRAAGHAEELIELLAAWQGNPPAAAYGVTDTVERLTGRPPRTFAQWAAEHAADFR